MKIHHAGKMGDLVYALPVLRALARTRGEKVTLVTSAHCWQMAPLLWEQPYIEDVEIDDSHPYEIVNNIWTGWDHFKNGEGINLSPQPAHYYPDSPVSWTMAYAKIAGINEITPADKVAFPTLINHRRFMAAHQAFMNGKAQEKPDTVIIAPESETLEFLGADFWNHILRAVSKRGSRTIVIGCKKSPALETDEDMRGHTTVPVLARLIADARGFIGAHSLPWHLARHSETPAICIQKFSDGLKRCIPVDTPCYWFEPEQSEEALTVLWRLMDALRDS